MQKILSYIKTHKILITVVVIVIAAGAYYWHSKSSTATTVKYITAQAQIQTLTSTVTESGQIAASDQVDIKPNSTATVTSVKVKQGSIVKSGDVLLTLDETTASQQVAQAKASLDSAKASYQNLLAGDTSTDLQLAQLSIDTANQNLKNDQQNLTDVTTQQQQDISNAYNSLLNSNLQLNPSDTLTTAPITISGNYTGTDKGSYTISVYQTGGGLSYSSSGLGSASGYITRGIQQSLGNGLYITFGTTGIISTTTTWTINIPNTAGSGYQNNLNAYNTALQGQTTALQNAQNKITSDQTAIQQAQIQYQQKITPPTDAAQAQAQAQVSQAQSSYDNALQTYNDNIIKAPIDGTVAAVNVSVGDQANSGSSGATETDLVTIITKDQVADISLNEIDAAKVKTGQKATMSFDAISNLTLTGTVAEIDTVGTVSQGVVTYNAKVALDIPNDQIKPGMSTSVTILNKSEPNVLTVPSTAVKTDSNGGNYVQELDSTGQPKNVTVTIGDSNDTDTVITSGLSEGDSVITQTVTSATLKSTSTTSLLGNIGGNRGGATGAARTSTGSSTTRTTTSSGTAGGPPGGQ
jgi:RND family efflux transporter MFP subunit